MGRKKKKKKEDEKPKVHKELEGLEININEFGEIESNLDIDKINKFLNRHVDDKKLRGRDDIPHYEEPTEEESDEWVDEEDELDIDKEDEEDGDDEK